MNDSMPDEEFHAFLRDAFSNACSVMAEGAGFYVWYASKEALNFVSALEESSLHIRQQLIWNKSSLTLGRQDYQWKHEPCLYGWKEGSHKWRGDRKQTTVIDFEKPSINGVHPTMKPVGLFDYQIRNSTDAGDKVLDLFCGSGTTIIACEQNKRVAYAMEYDPKYVDVIINRWEELTGDKAVLVSE